VLFVTFSKRSPANLAASDPHSFLWTKIQVTAFRFLGGRGHSACSTHDMWNAGATLYGLNIAQQTSVWFRRKALKVMNSTVKENHDCRDFGNIISYELPDPVLP
jgi:hypothetical protein